MAELNLTPSQQAIVDYRGGAMLVSAAAGSGKTMVLVQRLLARVCDPVHPCNVDDFLIITYTKKAASELRAKIMEALSRRLVQAPDNRHLRRQMQRIYSAQISTVHAFCADLLRAYSNQLSIQPDFRIAEETECAMLRQKTVERVLETAYAALDEAPDIRAAVDLLGAGRDDRALPELILAVFEQSRCSPLPDACLEDYLHQMELPVGIDASETIWGAWLCQRMRLFAAAQAEQFAHLLEEISCSAAYEAANGASLRHTMQDLQALASCTTWDEIVSQSVSFDRLKPVKKEDVSELRALVGAVRDTCKKELEKRRIPFYAPSAEVLQDETSTHAALRGLIDLTRKFSQAYSAAKTRRGVLDFGDLEHLTLQLLYGKQQQALTAAAREISQRYLEVMVDEYQDTNAVQDRIFCGVTNGGENLFMVGDVKQSIYRFRMADPTIFLQKYRSYPDFESGSSGPRRFFLSENFRSQAAILDAANHVFTAVMSEQVGDLAYTEQQRLRAGMPHPVLAQPCVELHCLETSAADDEDAPDKTWAEARFVAERIRMLLQDGTQISDGDITRSVRPGDIVILLRTLSSAETYLKAMQALGIPCACERSQSILETTEVSVLLSFLQVIDNPHQDIPLLSVLSSPLFCFTPDELTAIRMHNRQCSLFDAMQLDKQVKTQHFLELLIQLRQDALVFSLGALTEHLIRIAEMEPIFSVLEHGIQRCKNLRTFADFVRSSEAVYPTLSEFLQQMELMQAEGKAIPAETAAASDCVNIMTIHKSKGLEFPVVFLADLSRKFNEEDLHSPVLLHQTLGIGAMAMEQAHLIRFPTLSRSAIADRIRCENRSEELRVLYVAMTRAKDLLIMSYCSRYLRTELSSLAAALTFPVHPLKSAAARAPGHWILLSALCRAEAGALFDVTGIPACAGTFSDAPWHITLGSAEAGGSPESIDRQKEALLSAPDPEIVRRMLEFTYPDQLQTITPAKLTPTQLKGRVEDLESASEAASLQAPLQVHVRKPNFVQSKALTPAERGAAVHLALQFMDFSHSQTPEGVRQVLLQLVQRHHLTQQQADAVVPEQISAFVNSELGRRMVLAQAPPLREFKFSILADGSQFGNFSGKLLLQGVVDCCWEEPDGIVILDFKTDHVTEQTAQARAQQYRAQLHAYAYAMQQVLKRPVKECWLYFLSADCSIQIS